MPKTDRQHRRDIEQHVRKTLKMIVEKHEAGEPVSNGEVGFLIAVIENFLKL